jgi:hypothetical protein
VKQMFGRSKVRRYRTATELAWQWLGAGGLGLVNQESLTGDSGNPDVSEICSLRLAPRAY